MVAVPAPTPVTVPPETVATPVFRLSQVREGEAVTEVGLPSAYLRFTRVVVQLAVPPTLIEEGLNDRVKGSRRQVSVGV